MLENKLTRRNLLGGMAAVTAGSMTTLSRPRTSRAAGDDGPRFLIVLCASGGASIIDSVMAFREGECAALGGNPTEINCFPDEQVQDGTSMGIDTPFRAVDTQGTNVGPINMQFQAVQSQFVIDHHQDMMAVTMTGTSVNHQVAQRRSVTGNEAFHGRTLQESVANAYGDGFAIPNVHLVSGTAFSERGGDDSLPSWCFGEQVADPALWPLALDGVLGTAHPVDRSALHKARTLRDEALDPSSKFWQAFSANERLRHWDELRGAPLQAVEQAKLIDKLIYVEESADYPLQTHGLQPSPAAAAVRTAFPDYAHDPLHAQAALGFLLLKYGVSVTVTLGPDFNLALAEGASLQGGGVGPGDMYNPPIGFDFSHQGHRSTQAFMWDRLYRVADGLIRLLKNEPFEGGTMWDRTMIYIASDFGRTKRRSAAPDFGTGHDLNNGLLVISPLVNGNQALGGLDPTTGLTYGFDPETGCTDCTKTMTEPQIHAGLLGALGIDPSGVLEPVPVMSAGQPVTGCGGPVCP